MATFVSELFDISKTQQINVTVMSPNRYQQLITFQLQSISQIDIVNFLICSKDICIFNEILIFTAQN